MSKNVKQSKKKSQQQGLATNVHTQKIAPSDIWFSYKIS